jgi:ribosome-associated protein
VTNTQAKKIEGRLLDREEARPTLIERGGDSQAGLEEAHRAVAAALARKGLEPVLLDMRELCSYTNYILIVSGRSDRQVDAIAEGIREELKPELRPLGTEGIGSGQWALLDFGDVIVHVFYHPIREHYHLEGLWNDAPRIPLEIPEEARASYEDSYR